MIESGAIRLEMGTLLLYKCALTESVARIDFHRRRNSISRLEKNTIIAFLHKKLLVQHRKSSGIESRHRPKVNKIVEIFRNGGKIDEILQIHIAINAIQHSKIDFVDTFGDFSCTIE